MGREKAYADNASNQSQILYKQALSPLHVDKGGDFVHVLNTNLWNRTDVVFLDSMVNLNEKELITRTGEKVEHSVCMMVVGLLLLKIYQHFLLRYIKSSRRKRVQDVSFP